MRLAVLSDAGLPEDVHPASAAELAGLGDVRVVALGPAGVLVRSYLQASTFNLFPTLPPDCSLEALLHTFCRAREITDSLVVRRDERRALRAIKESTGRVRVKRGAGSGVSSPR